MKQIIAMGGGGFSMEPDNLLLDMYVLKQSGAARPKICFIPTASGDSDGYIQRFYDSFQELPCEPSHLSLFRNQPQDLKSFILEKDILYVGGGNTRNMLVLWKEWGLDQHIRSAWESGVILAGLSAGAICWFEEGVTDSLPGPLSSLKCLGFLKGSSCPHYDGEADRRDGYHRLLQDGSIESGIAMDDGAAVHYRDESIYKVISSRPHARVYQVSYSGNEVTEDEIIPEYLG